jgi:hypothetical protein
MSPPDRSPSVGAACIQLIALDVRRARRHEVGVLPVTWRKCFQRCAWSVNPHRSAMSLREASVCSMYCSARFSRRRIKNAFGESAKVRLNEREKWASLSLMSAQRSATRSGSAM